MNVIDKKLMAYELGIQFISKIKKTLSEKL
jgi:hypothetical protein